MSISGIVEKIRQWKIRRYVRRLIARGLSLGKNVYLNDGFFLDPSHCHLITIEDYVVFGPFVKVFAHDASSLKVCGKTKIGLVHLKRNCFIGADAVILPGAVVGENSILAANSTLSSVMPDNEVWAGSPAKFLMGIEAYRRKLEEEAAADFSEAEFRQEALTEEKRGKMVEELRRWGSGFMRP